MRLRARLARTPPGYQYSIGRVLTIYLGLMVTLLLAALDQTIVATALPQIVSDVGGVTQYSWVFTAYMLTATVTVPIYGRLGDVHGRRPLLLIAITIFLVGSALCGLAQGMTELIVFRAIQGIGAGGLFPLSLAVIGGLVPPRDRGRWQGLIGAVFATASIAGPAIGGFIADNSTWRWVFLVNVPIAALALFVIWLTMPRRSVRADHSIDWLGAGLLSVGTAAFLLGLVWGGHDYAWSSGHVVVALSIAVVVLLAFALVERRTAEPILPFELLRNPIVAGSVACMALVGMAMFGTVVYAPLFVQGVIGTTATSSGVVLTPLLLGAVITSFLTGQLISRTGHYRWNVLAGPPVLALGMALLWQMDVDTTSGEAARNMVIAGIGIGAMMQVFVLSIQNAVARDRIGAATALGTFSRQIGATIGVTVMGVIVNHGLPSAAAAGDGVPIHRLPPALRGSLASAIRPAFLAATVVALLVWVIAVLWVKEVPLRKSVDELPPTAGIAPETGPPG
jgi:EmrB/QacA subfamily drug resistance transporter